MSKRDKTLCIIIPIYKERLKITEKKAIFTYIEYFLNIDIYFICSRKLETIWYEKQFSQIKFVPFDNYYFISNKSYNNLMLNTEFYKRFIDYKYMIIAQTDAMIVNPSIDINNFLQMDYDYMGAPWYYSPFSIKDGFLKYIVKRLIIHDSLKNKCGNGGFSLRKISTMIEILESTKIYRKLVWRFNEDIFFSYICYKKKYNIAPINIAEKFSLEQNMIQQLSNGNYPLAVHAWEKVFNSYEELKNILKTQKMTI